MGQRVISGMRTSRWSSLDLQCFSLMICSRQDDDRPKQKKRVERGGLWSGMPSVRRGEKESGLETLERIALDGLS